MIVCALCKQWMWENESEDFTIDNGILKRIAKVHKNHACPSPSNPTSMFDRPSPVFFGDD